MNKNIFRAYDIRGHAKKDLDSTTIEKIGYVLGQRVKENNFDSVYIGHDSRLSCERIKNDLIKGINAAEVKVLNLGLVPTPMVYYATKVGSTSNGIMITGSHNPKDDNGLKMVINDNPISGTEIKESVENLGTVPINGSKIMENIDFEKKYIEEVVNKIKISKKLKVVLDGGNGAAGILADKMFNALGLEVVSINKEPDGNFPNHHPDPTVPENMEQLIKAVEDYNCDIGLAFDGDGDRLGVVDNLGNLVWADQYMLLLCMEIANLYDNPKIIMDVKCSKVFFDEAKKLNCDPIMSKTGHSPIKEKMKELNSPLSGEMSGHVCYADDFYGYDDAMYVALRLLRILCNQEKSLNELINVYPKTFSTHETRFDVDETKKFLIIDEIKDRIKNTEGEIIDIDGIRVENDDGWFLMRASNTQNQLTCRAESTSHEGLKSLIEIIENQLSLSGVNYKFTI